MTHQLSGMVQVWPDESICHSASHGVSLGNFLLTPVWAKNKVTPLNLLYSTSWTEITEGVVRVKVFNARVESWAGDPWSKVQYALNYPKIIASGFLHANIMLICRENRWGQGVCVCVCARARACACVRACVCACARACVFIHWIVILDFCCVIKRRVQLVRLASLCVLCAPIAQTHWQNEAKAPVFSVRLKHNRKGNLVSDKSYRLHAPLQMRLANL